MSVLKPSALVTIREKNAIFFLDILAQYVRQYAMLLHVLLFLKAFVTYFSAQPLGIRTYCGAHFGAAYLETDAGPRIDSKLTPFEYRSASTVHSQCDN